MTFKTIQDELSSYLKTSFSQIDFENDFELQNKINALAWILSHRLNSPSEKKVKVKTEYVDKERWR